MTKGDILAFLAKNPGEHSVKELSSSIGISKNAVCSAINRCKWGKQIVVRRQLDTGEYWVKLPDKNHGDI